MLAASMQLAGPLTLACHVTVPACVLRYCRCCAAKCVERGAGPCLALVRRLDSMLSKHKLVSGNVAAALVACRTGGVCFHVPKSAVRQSPVPHAWLVQTVVDHIQTHQLLN